MKKGTGRAIRLSILILFVMFVAIQFIPYGRNRANPPVVREPDWDSPKTRELAKRACFDCHSNESVWPWYSRAAPASWLIWSDIQGGRTALNFSEWQGSGRKSETPDELAKEINEGEMPPFQYALFHPASRLADAEKRQLIEGLALTVRQSVVKAK